jgi:hypothetical protein
VERTFEGLRCTDAEPEERNKHGNCPDFRAQTTRETLTTMVGFLAGAVMVWWVCFYVLPTLFRK